MTNKEVRVVLLGGSGNLGRSVFQRLDKIKNVSIKATYYENRPKWASEDKFFYLNGAASSLDEDTTSIITDADIILNIMSPRRHDFIEGVLFDTPLKIAELIAKTGGRFITFGGTLNQNSKQTVEEKTIERLSNVLTERELGVSVFSSLIINKNSRITKVISALSKYKLTPTVGDGGNKVRAIHTTDFSMICARLLNADIKSGRYSLIGREPMTMRYLISLTCESEKITKPIFVNIKKSIAHKYKGLMSNIFDMDVTDKDIESLDYKEMLIGKEICSELKIKPLSFSARVRREGF